MNQIICALRKGQIAELETINEYRKLQACCKDNEKAYKIFDEIIDDELNHVGNFEEIIAILCPKTQEKINKGKIEARDVVENRTDIETMLHQT